MTQLQMKLTHSEKSTQAVSDTLSEKQKEVGLVFILCYICTKMPTIADNQLLECTTFAWKTLLCMVMRCTCYGSSYFSYY